MKTRDRDQSGFSLPTVIALGVVASLWMLATASLIVPARAKLTVERTADMARASAEAGLDYALNQFNTSLNNQGAETTALSSTSMTIPAQYMADYNSGTGTTNFTGTITLANAAPPYKGQGAAYTSYLYDQTVDNSVSGGVLSGGQNYWR